METHPETPLSLAVRAGQPDFLDLPWRHPLEEWQHRCSRLEELPRGLSRHPVVFLNYDGMLYALKELPADLAEKEYDLLLKMEELKLPAVKAAGHARTSPGQGELSVLITRYLDNSLPYSSLFTQPNLARYREHLLDALAGLLVQLHLSGVYWGDCSLYNTLFRRDAGALQAYLVDAETAEIHPGLSSTLRAHDLEIMEENVVGGLSDLVAAAILNEDYPVEDTGSSIHDRYWRLWDEITREAYIHPQERYRIRERINALNALGFSVAEIELNATEKGDLLRLNVVVTDRNFHRHQLHNLTGVYAEEMQARQMVNEIKELKATLSTARKSSVPLSVAAYHWQNHYYLPIIEKLVPLLKNSASETELYCQFLEHKWFLSERAQRDVGREIALKDFLSNPPA